MRVLCVIISRNHAFTRLFTLLRATLCRPSLNYKGIEGAWFRSFSENVLASSCSALAYYPSQNSVDPSTLHHNCVKTELNVLPCKAHQYSATTTLGQDTNNRGASKSTCTATG